MKRISNFTSAIIVLALIASVSAGAVYAEDQKPATEVPAATAPAAAPAAAAAPAPPAVTGSASLAVLNHYMFRGYELNNGSVVIQPTATINYSGFSATFWSNIDSREKATQSFTPDRPGKTSYNETDLTLNYTYNIDKLALTGGYTYYGIKYNNNAETQELYLSAAYDMIAHPTLAVYRDIDNFPGTYLNLSFSQSLPVFKMASGDATVDLGAGFGYEAGDSNVWKTYVANRGYVGSNYSAFHDGHVQVGFTAPLTSKFSVQPIVQYWFPLSGDASKTITDRTGVHDFNPDGHLADKFVYGVNLNFNF